MLGVKALFNASTVFHVYIAVYETIFLTTLSIKEVITYDFS